MMADMAASWLTQNQEHPFQELEPVDGRAQHLFFPISLLRVKHIHRLLDASGPRRADHAEGTVATKTSPF
jgi:hypothetical protein